METDTSGDKHKRTVLALRSIELYSAALSAAADQTEEMRRLPQETETWLHEAGLFKILQPERLGGFELDYVALVDICEALARADASVAWNVANLSSHHWMLGMFPPAAQSAVWDNNPDALIASSFIFPAGKASPEEGGYRLTGRWPFCSGVDPSSWNMLGAVVASQVDGDPPEYRIFLVPRHHYEIQDTWFATGLKGTGSKDVEVKDVFVSQDMTLGVGEISGGATPGSQTNGSALYRLPVFALFPFVLSGCALGNAQACLDDFVQWTGQRASKYSGTQLSQLQSVRIHIAAAGARIDAARRIMRGICIEAMQDAQNNHVPDLLTKTRYRRDGAFAVGLCTEAVDGLFSASGAGALYTGRRLQRQFRDAHAINAHIAFNFDAAGSNNGSVELGLASDNPTL